jgi:lipopolysaccharide assembly protein A
MRFLQSVVFLSFLVVIGVFAVQNTNTVTVNFFSWSLSQPFALLAVAIYFLGMLSGWTVVSFVRRSVPRVTQRPS